MSIAEAMNDCSLGHPADHPPRRKIDLPFVANDVPSPSGFGRCFWSVSPSGDYAADLTHGEDLGVAFLRYLDSDDIISGSIFGWIVLDMAKAMNAREPDDSGHSRRGIEIGFLHVIAVAARGNARYAERVIESEREMLADILAEAREREAAAPGKWAFLPT